MKNRLLLSLALGLVAACGPSDGDDDDDSCEGLAAGDLVITEIQADLAGTDDGKEWIEIYNATGAAIDLTGLEVVHAKDDLTGERVHVMGAEVPAGEVAAGGYYVIGAVLDEFKPGHVDYGLANDVGAFRNTNGLFALRCGPTEVDSTTYEAVDEDVSRALNGATTPDYIANDDETNWCASVTSYLGNELGTPGAANDSCGVPGMCNDGGTLREPVAPTAGDLVITEIMPNPDAVGDTEGEWFEVFVANPVDLNGLQIGRSLDDLSSLNSPDCLSFGAGAYVLFAKGSDPLANGGLPAVDFEFSFSMVNSAGTLVVAYDDQLLDQVTWTSSDTGASTSLDPDTTNPTDNDDEANWCPGATAYGDGDFGTPGSANDDCLGAGECFDGASVRTVVKPTVDDLIITEFMPNPNAVGDTAGEWFEVFAAANVDLNGLQLGRAFPTVDETLTSSNCLAVTAGTYLLFAKNADSATNGGLPAVDHTFGFSLGNSGGGVFVAVDDGLLDAVTWTADGLGGPGEATQLDPDLFDVTLNDDLGNWCVATTAYGDGDLGTPAAGNLQCM